MAVKRGKNKKKVVIICSKKMINTERIEDLDSIVTPR